LNKIIIPIVIGIVIIGSTVILFTNIEDLTIEQIKDISSEIEIENKMQN